MTSSPAWLPDTLTMTPVEPLIGSYEIGVMFGVSRQRVYQLTTRPDFPKPVVTLKVGQVWSTAEVVEWAKSKGRQIEEDK